MVVDGYTPIENPVGLVQIAEQEKLENLNAKATNILYCGLSKTEFNRISNCTTAKEIRTLLEVTHEGTSQVKKSRIAMLMKQYQMFTMLPTESITDMFTRFSDLTNPLSALGKKLTTEEMVQKILTSLPPQWNAKTKAIEEANDVSTISFEELIGKLMAHEVCHAPLFQSCQPGRRRVMTQKHVRR